jgi:sialate O-acetylesterase
MPKFMQNSHTRLIQVVVLFLSLLLLDNSALAGVRLPALFSDHMVIQQKSDVALWGWADPGETIEIRAGWTGKPVTVMADSEGNWKTTIQTIQAGGPYTLQFNGKNEIKLQDVMLGEVWLCSGQSNMHFPVAPLDASWATGVINYEEEIKSANYPSIRMFTVERKVADEPQKDVVGDWQVCSPATVREFSAVAYFFAREITKETGLPVGLINSSWGGTPAESWTRKDVLEADADFVPILERYKRDLEKYPEAMKSFRVVYEQWKKEAEEARQKGEKPKGAPREPIGPNHNKSPYKLYNAMIAPLIPYTIKGAIWYQGESNAERAFQYRKLFPAMINNWRKDWGSDFPFYFVQIAPHRSQRPEIREAQLLTMLSVPKTGMAVITDTGDSLDIHPRNKQVVGKRLAVWALAKEYGKKEVVYSGPIYKTMKIKGNKIYVSFDHTGGGLVAMDSSLKEFTIAGPDQQFVPAQAKIDGKSIVIWSEQVSKPVAVRFAWKRIPEPNLYNKAGLPASPFRTDTWLVETQGEN